MFQRYFIVILEVLRGYFGGGGRGGGGWRGERGNIFVILVFLEVLRSMLFIYLVLLPYNTRVIFEEFLRIDFSKHIVHKQLSNFLLLS